MEVGAQSCAIIALLLRDSAHPAAIFLPATSQFRDNSSIDAGLGRYLALRCATANGHHFAWWPMEEALKALPTALDDNSFAAFNSIMPTDRATRPMVYAQMAAIFEPPSSARQKLLSRQREDVEKPLAFCSALLALARAAYISMDVVAKDLLALERLIFLARALGVALSVADEADSLVPQSGTRYSGAPQPVPATRGCGVCSGPEYSDGCHDARRGPRPLCRLHCPRPTGERCQRLMPEPAVVPEIIAFAAEGGHHLFPLRSGGSHCCGLPQLSGGLQRILVVLRLYISVVLGAAGKLRRITLPAAPST
ncbi:unnamed protein product [Lampetra fluviatilis]